MGDSFLVTVYYTAHILPIMVSADDVALPLDNNSIILSPLFCHFWLCSHTIQTPGMVGESVEYLKSSFLKKMNS